MFAILWILVGAAVLAVLAFAGYWFGRAMRAITPTRRSIGFGFSAPGFWHDVDDWGLVWCGTASLVALVVTCWILGGLTFVVIEQPWEKQPAEAVEVAK